MPFATFKSTALFAALLFPPRKGNIQAYGESIVSEGYAIRGGHPGSDTTGTAEYSRVRDASSAGGILHRRGIHDVSEV